MEIIDTIQGSEHWNQLRASRYTASEAPVMMGAAKASRNDLLRVKATGSEQEFSEWVHKNLFDRGHQYEEAARPIAERIIGEDLFPATVTEEVDGLPLLASCDGMTMLGDVLFEHKMPNKDLVAAVEADELPPGYYWQLEHQLLVTGAECVLFAVSDGTEANFVSLMYSPVEGRREQLIKAWQQFDADLRHYEPPEEKPEVTGKAPENLPALRIEVTGEVRDSNLDSFREHALSVIGSISTDLDTDEDFASADKTVKWCSEVEKRLEAAKQHALSQTETIDTLFRTIDDIKEQARQKRLELDKLVKARKQTIRDEIRQNTVEVLRDHFDTINASLPDYVDMAVPSDFGQTVGTAMKGRKTIKSLRDAADDALAKAKIEANEWAGRVHANHKRFTELADGHESLFPDRGQLVFKPTEDMEATIKARIAEHEAEQKRREEQRKEQERFAEERRQEQERRRQEEEAARQQSESESRTEKSRDEEEAVEADSAAEQADAGVPEKGEASTGRSVFEINCKVRLELHEHASEGDAADRIQQAFSHAGLPSPEILVERKESRSEEVA